MDDGMQGRNAKPENGQAAETRAEVNFRVPTVHTPGIETYTLPIPESGQQAGLVTDEECGWACIFNLPTVTGKHFSQHLETCTRTAQGLGGVLLESPGLFLYSSSPVPQIFTFT